MRKNDYFCASIALYDLPELPEMNSNRFFNLSHDILSQTRSQKSAERFSNYEALRVFAMLLVLLAHSTYFSCGTPVYSEVYHHPLSFLYYAGVESLGLVSVNCFVLISGYFGIRIKLRSVANLIFIFLFYKIGSLIVAALVNREMPMNLAELVAFFFVYEPDWFVWSYIVMLLFVPMMNMYVEVASKKSLRKFILLYLAVATLSCYVCLPGVNFVGGFSILTLFPLYIIGAYYRKYSEKSLSVKHKRSGIMVYLGLSVVAPALVLLESYIHGHFLNFFVLLQNNLNSPFVVAGSVGVLLFFSSLSFKSSLVNWLGKSAFAVYMIHLNPFVVDTFKGCAHWVFVNTWPWLWFPSVIVYVCVVYLLCTLIDQLRIYSWKWVSKLLP